jgi:hypothetical protein
MQGRHPLRLNIYSAAMFRYLAPLVFLLAALPAASREDIRLAHALDGVPKWELDQLAARFNKAQAEFRVVPVHSAWP